MEIVPPWQVEWVAVGHDLDDLAINADGIVASDFHIGIESAEHGVVLQQVRSLLDAAGVVDDDDVEGGVLPAVPAADEVAANASEAIDGDLDLGLCDGPRGARARGLLTSLQVELTRG